MPSAAVKSVTGTKLPGRYEPAIKIVAHKNRGVVTLNAENNLDAMVLKDCLGSGSHSTREHGRRALFFDPHGKCTASVFRRGMNGLMIDTIA